jgi:branched-chain amino acid transport system substrate-binding protein
MKMRSGLGISLAFLCSLLAISAVPAGAAETVRIGLLVPFTGGLAMEGNRTWMGFQVAADMVNDKGGVWGKKVEYIKGDSVTPDSAISEMERLITVEKLNLIAGGYSSSRVFAASEINEKYKKVYWVSTAVAENITSRGLKYIFRYNIPSSKLGGAKVIYTAEKLAPALGKKVTDLRVAIVYEDSLWGSSTAKVETEDAPKYKLNIVANESYSAKAVDLSPLIMKLRAARPDVILMTGYVNDTNLFWRQCKEMDFNFAALLESGAVLGQPEWEQTFGKDVNYTLGMGNRPADPNVLSPKGREIQKEALKRFAEKFKVVNPGDHHLLAFEAGYILLTEVLPAAGSMDPEKIREAALKVNKSWKDSINGMGCHYAPPGHAMAGQNLEATPFIHQWQNRKLITLYPDHAAAGKLEMPQPTWDQRKKMK